MKPARSRAYPEAFWDSITGLVLRRGEFAFETDTGLLYVGDGTTPYASLDPINGDSGPGITYGVGVEDALQEDLDTAGGLASVDAVASEVAAINSDISTINSDLVTLSGYIANGSHPSLDASAWRTALSLVIGTNVQAYDADLTSWAAITRAAGFDTFVATPSSANLASLVTGETGTGGLVFDTSPTLVTPNIGAATGTSLTLASGLVALNSVSTGSPATLGGRLQLFSAASPSNAFEIFVGEDTSAASAEALHIVPYLNSTRLHLGSSSKKWHALVMTNVNQIENHPLFSTPDGLYFGNANNFSAPINMSVSRGPEPVTFADKVIICGNSNGANNGGIIFHASDSGHVAGSASTYTARILPGKIFDLINSFASATNNELGRMAWESNVLRMGTVKGSGGGTARVLALMTDNVNRFVLGASGGVQFATGTYLPTVSKNANYTATINDHTIRVDASGGSRTITLPTAAAAYNSTVGAGMVLIIKKTDSSGNSVIIDGDGSETIDGATTVTITTQYQSYKIQSNGTSWDVI